METCCQLTRAVLEEQLHVGRLQLAVVLKVKVAGAIGGTHWLPAGSALWLIVNILILKGSQPIVATILPMPKEIVILRLCVLLIVVLPGGVG